MNGPDGTPWHSWRVLILKNAPYPYSELYKVYRFDEPWNGPNNVRLSNRIGDYYRRQELDADGSLETSFVAVIGAGRPRQGQKPGRDQICGTVRRRRS